MCAKKGLESVKGGVSCDVNRRLASLYENSVK